MKLPEGRLGWLIRVAFAVAVVVGLGVVAYLGVPIGRSDTESAPNVGNFTAGSVECSTVRGPIPEISFRGKWRGAADAVVLVSTDRGWTLLEKDAVQPFIDGQPQPQSSYMIVPAWDGVPGHEPDIAIKVSNPAPAQPVYFMIRWQQGVEYGLMASAHAGDASCVPTNNPQPR